MSGYTDWNPPFYRVMQYSVITTLFSYKFNLFTLHLVFTCNKMLKRQIMFLYTVTRLLKSLDSSLKII